MTVLLVYTAFLNKSPFRSLRTRSHMSYYIGLRWQGGAVYIDDGGSLTTEGKVDYIDNEAVRLACLSLGV